MLFLLPEVTLTPAGELPHVCLWLGALPGALQLVCCVIVQNVLEGSVPD